MRAVKIAPIAFAERGPVVKPVPRDKPSKLSPRIAVVISLLFLGIVSALALEERVPILLPPIYLVLSLITVFAYAFDKSAAMNRRWRTQESTLHILSLLGGWPGAWIAQLAFRHKTKKTSFVATFVVCVIVNLAALSWIVVEPANPLVRLLS